MPRSHVGFDLQKKTHGHGHESHGHEHPLLDPRSRKGNTPTALSGYTIGEQRNHSANAAARERLYTPPTATSIPLSLPVQGEPPGGRVVLTCGAWAPVKFRPIFSQICHPVDYLAPPDSSLRAASNKPILKSVSGLQEYLRRFEFLKRGLP